VKGAARITNAYFCAPSELAFGSGSTQLSELLSKLIGTRLCLVEVDRTDGHFTFAVDADWAEMGLLSAGDGAPSEDELPSFQLPRSALRAVVAGWPADWDDVLEPRIEVHVSKDLVPHLSLADDQLVIDLSD
jgi:hypothetical protein